MLRRKKSRSRFSAVNVGQPRLTARVRHSEPLTKHVMREFFAGPVEKPIESSAGRGKKATESEVTELRKLLNRAMAEATGKAAEALFGLYFPKAKFVDRPGHDYVLSRRKIEVKGKRNPYEKAFQTFYLILTPDNRYIWHNRAADWLVVITTTHTLFGRCNPLRNFVAEEAAKRTFGKRKELRVKLKTLVEKGLLTAIENKRLLRNKAFRERLRKKGISV